MIGSGSFPIFNNAFSFNVFQGKTLFFKKKRLRLFDTASLTSVNVYLFSVCVMMNKQLLRAFPSPNGYKDSDSTFRSPNSFDESPEKLNE